MKSIILFSFILLSTLAPMTAFSAAGEEAGTTLSAYIEATPVYRCTYPWSIEKTANATNIYLSPSSPVVYVEYAVSVEKLEPECQYSLEGYVSVTNGGDRATEGLSISIDVYANPPWKNQIINDYPVDVSSYPVIYPGETVIYYFSIPVPEDYWNTAYFKLTGNVTILNHSGWLGQPFGPSPSTTTSSMIIILVNDEVHVQDSNGYEWTFTATSQVSYIVEFNYDASRGDYYVHENTAIIVETGQSSTWTVEIYQELPRASTISGIVFWDNNFDGVYNEGDTPIWNVQVDLYLWDDDQGWVYLASTYTNEAGHYYFSVDASKTYKTVVHKPICYECLLVESTTPEYYEIIVEEGYTYPGNDFGFVCLVQLTGAKSKGYWSWSLYDKKARTWATRIGGEDVNYVNQALNTSFTSPLEIANYLTTPVYGDMKTALTQQLIATLLNLKYGYVNGSNVVYYNDTFTTINEIVNNSINALSLQDRATQEYYKTLLDFINNNCVLIARQI
ncbi:MAG: SdrD B-like domain-containing protein [Thermosphaera sp.]